MAKSKHGKDDEYYRGIIREQAKEIKSLQRRIKQLNKYEHFKEKLDPILKVKEAKLEICVTCHNGSMEPVFIFDRQFFRCNHCSYRTKAIKL